MFNLLFIHGFGGRDNHPDFVQLANDFIKKHRIDCNLDTFTWNSEKASISDAGLSFTGAMKKAEESSTEIETKIAGYELGKSNYYIVAYSLGCHLFNEFLNRTEKKSKLCAGIIYIGAASWADQEINQVFIPKDAKILNYFSPKHDLVLHELYANKMGHSAGGMAGFTCSLFRNFRCSATHQRKGVGIHSDWSQMAVPILELIAINEKSEIPGQKDLNIKWAIGKGEDWWNNVIELERHEFEGFHQSIWVQQHKFEGHYRLSVAKQGAENRKRIANARKLHPIFNLIKYGKDSDEWVFNGYQNP